MLLSMTGFGTYSVQLPQKKIIVDVKSLNSKQLDLNCRLPHSMRSVEVDIRSIVSSVVERGKVDLTVTVEHENGVTSSTINVSTVASYKEQIEKISEATGLPLPEDWFSVLLRLPDVLTSIEDRDEHSEEQKEVLLDAVRGALECLMEYRRAEGRQLEEFFEVRIERIRQLLSDVPKYENERIEKIKSRITESLSKIPQVEYDKGRLEQEMIYYIEKLDINEEKQRLTQHLDYFMETMRQPKPGQGKKLGFITQEMTREINTLGSKSNHAEMQNIVVRMKDELEQIKEQVLNVM